MWWPHVEPLRLENLPSCCNARRRRVWQPERTAIFDHSVEVLLARESTTVSVGILSKAVRAARCCLKIPTCVMVGCCCCVTQSTCLQISTHNQPHDTKQRAIGSHQPPAIQRKIPASSHQPKANKKHKTSISASSYWQSTSHKSSQRHIHQTTSP